jgi:hypothetical protein
MGQQQLLLIILGVIIVGIAIAVGLQLFQSGTFTGGNGYQVPDRLRLTANVDDAGYAVDPGADVITIDGTSALFPTASAQLTYTPGAELEADRYVWVFTEPFRLN